MTPITAEAPAYTPPQPEHLLGDLGGARSHLENHGIYLSLSATAEFAGNVSGCAKQGATSANQIAFSADIDWQLALTVDLQASAIVGAAAVEAGCPRRSRAQQQRQRGDALHGILA